jgi:hypothetical protein
VFLDVFWAHLSQKNAGERRRRVTLFPCAIDLIQHTTYKPEVFVRGNEKFYRFFGESKDGLRFAVQIKQDKKGQRHLMSVFEYRKPL